MAEGGFGAKLQALLSSMRGNIKVVAAVSGGLLIFFLILIANMLINIPPGRVGLVTKRTGEALPPNASIAPIDDEHSYKGLQERVLTTGWHLVNPITTDVDVVAAIEVPKGKKGLVNRTSGPFPENRSDVVVPKGFRGYQRDLLDPGIHFLNPKLFEVEIVEPVVIPALHVGIVTAKIGEVSGEDIVEAGFKGVQREVLRPGDYWLNPKAYSVEIVTAIDIPDGHLGVVRSRTGESTDKDLVEEGERGIWRKVLRPSTYYMNTKAYEISVVPAVKIEAGFVGVVIARTGDPPKEPNAVVVEKGERGVQPYTLPAGLHYLNPYECKVIPVDSRVQKYEMSGVDTTLSQGEIAGDDRLQFPSSDGFAIKVDTSIEWQIQTDRIPRVVATIGNTQDIVTKIIRPNAREIGRLEGSKLKAEDFIKGDKREQFVTNFSATLKKRCEEKGIIIHKALVREVEPPEEVARPLKEREVAILNQSTNEEKQKTAMSEALLAEEQAKIEQKRLVIKAETEKKIKETLAEQEKAVAKIKAEQLKEVAQVEKEQQALILEKQRLEAQGIRELADAEAHRARELVLADGALDKKLKAWTEVMREWAGNRNLVPRVVVGGGDGEHGGLTGQELILELMAIEHLDRFVKQGVEMEEEEDKEEKQQPAPAQQPAGAASGG